MRCVRTFFVLIFTKKKKEEKTLTCHSVCPVHAYTCTCVRRYYYTAVSGGVRIQGINRAPVALRVNIFVVRALTLPPPPR